MSEAPLCLGGFMAVGKSTVGPILAARLGWSFVDLDLRVADDTGRSPAEWFAGAGEGAFREAELRALGAVLSRPRVVLALGGGTLHRRPAREAVRAAGAPCVMLRATWETVAPRIQASERPLRHVAAGLYAERSSAEGRCRAPAVWVDGRSPAAVADAVLEALRWVA